MISGRKQREVVDEQEPISVGGRPCKYITVGPERMCQQAHEMALTGMNDTQIAACLLISKQTMSNYRDWFPEFNEAIESARTDRIGKVVDALYQRAIGWSHPDVKVLSTKNGIEIVPVTKYYPPDVTAQLAILYNRMPHLWKSATKLEVVAPDQGDSDVPEMDYELLSEEEFAIFNKLAQKAMRADPIALPYIDADKTDSE